MREISGTTQQVLGWTLAAVSGFHAAVLVWGAATWSQRLEEDLRDDYGELSPYVRDYLSSRGAPVEFLLAVLAALACVAWVLVARWGYAPAFLQGWKGRAALAGGGTVTLLYLAAAIVPLMIIVNPRDVERIPSWDALGAGGDAMFLGIFLIDAIAVAWWTFDRARQPERR